MRNLVTVFTFLALVPTAGLAQNRNKQYTAPRLPEQTDLDRANLQVGFMTTLPMDGKRDGVATIQLFDDLLVVQLRSGTIVGYDAERGVVRWAARQGGGYPPLVHNAAADDRYVITVRDVRMFALDRKGGHVEWMYELPTVPSGPPSSDGERVYIAIGDQVTAYDLPARPDTAGPAGGMISDTKTKPPLPKKESEKVAAGNVRQQPAPTMASSTGSGKPLPPSLSGSQATPSIAVLESVAPPYRLNSNTRQTTASIAVLPSVVPPFRLNSEVQSTPAITVLNKITRLDELSQKNLPVLALKKSWVMTLGVRVNQAPLVTSSTVVFPSTRRDVFASSRYVAQEMFHVETSGTIAAGLAQFGDTVFAPTLDASLLAVEGVRGRVLWRFTADSGIFEKPAVIGDDIFVVSRQGQLYRVNREVGESAWRDTRGDRFVADTRSFVAANDRYVYAVDSIGQLTVIDRSRGIPLQKLDTHDFTVSLSNDQTDRLYLAANNGSLLCLHDRSNAKPKRHPKGGPSSGSGTGGDSATELFRPGGAIKSKKTIEPPKSKEAKPKDDAPKDDKPKDTKPKDTKPKGKKGKDDMPKDEKN